MLNLASIFKGPPPRTVNINVGNGERFGMVLHGDAPVQVSHIDPGSAAEKAGFRVNDVILAINTREVAFFGHTDVLEVLKFFVANPSTSSPVGGMALTVLQMTTKQARMLRSELTMLREAEAQYHGLKAGSTGARIQRYSLSELRSEGMLSSMDAGEADLTSPNGLMSPLSPDAATPPGHRRVGRPPKLSMPDGVGMGPGQELYPGSPVSMISRDSVQWPERISAVPPSWNPDETPGMNRASMLTSPQTEGRLARASSDADGYLDMSLSRNKPSDYNPAMVIPEASDAARESLQSADMRMSLFVGDGSAPAQAASPRAPSPRSRIATFDPFSGHRLGDRVIINGYDTVGTVAFVGMHHIENKPRLGVVLDDPVGRNNGVVKEFKYFDCPGGEGYGLLIHPKKAERA